MEFWILFFVAGLALAGVAHVAETLWNKWKIARAVHSFEKMLASFHELSDEEEGLKALKDELIKIAESLVSDYPTLDAGELMMRQTQVHLLLGKYQGRLECLVG